MQTRHHDGNDDRSVSSDGKGQKPHPPLPCANLCVNHRSLEHTLLLTLFEGREVVEETSICNVRVNNRCIAAIPLRVLCVPAEK